MPFYRDFLFRLGCSLHIYSFFAYDLSRQIIKPFWTHFKTDFVCSNLTVLPIGKLVTFKIAIQFKVTFFVVCLYNCRFSFHKLAFFLFQSFCILLEENIYMKMAFEIIVHHTGQEQFIMSIKLGGTGLIENKLK